MRGCTRAPSFSVLMCSPNGATRRAILIRSSLNNTLEDDFECSHRHVPCPRIEAAAVPRYPESVLVGSGQYPPIRKRSDQIISCLPRWTRARCLQLDSNSIITGIGHSVQTLSADWIIKSSHARLHRFA